jgi:hypothetical protein
MIVTGLNKLTFEHFNGKFLLMKIFTKIYGLSLIGLSILSLVALFLPWPSTIPFWLVALNKVANFWFFISLGFQGFDSVCKYTEGRQGSGYKVCTLFKSEKLKRDAYLIKFERGSSIPEHKDPAPEGFRHWRLNIILPVWHVGGKFKTKTTLEEYNPKYVGFTKEFLGFTFIKFSPSEITHSVEEVIWGTRFVLSFGWLEKIS